MSQKYYQVWHSFMACQAASRKIGNLTMGPSQDLYNKINPRWQEVTKALQEAVVLHYTVQLFSTHAVRSGEIRGGHGFGLKQVPRCF